MCKYDYKKCKKCRNNCHCRTFIKIEVRQLTTNFKMIEKKDKVRIWCSSYRVPCDNFFRTELTSEEYCILVLIFQKFKFQAEINDSCVTLRRVRVQNYELTLQKDVVGIYKLVFKIINV